MIASEIFERGVQDPFCQDCDYEDETDVQSFIGPNDFVTSKLASFNFENSLKNNYSRNSSNSSTNVGNTSRHNGSHVIGHHLRKIKTAPHHLSGFAPPNSSNYSNETVRPSPRRIRANSSTLIHQLSRQSTRKSSLGDVTDCCVEHKCIKPKCRHSSCYGIPTHLYGLEKYVSSELDSLTVNSDQSNGFTPPSTSISTPASNSNSYLNLNSNSTAYSSSHPSSEKNNRLKLISHGKVSPSNATSHCGNPIYYSKERTHSNLRRGSSSVPSTGSSSVPSTGSSSSPLQTRNNSYSNSLVKSSSNSSLNTSVTSSGEEPVPHTSNCLEDRNPRRKSFIKLSLASSFSN